MENGKGAFFALNIILLGVFLGLIKIIFKLTGRMFVLEFLVIAVLLLLSLISSIMIFNYVKSGSTIMFFTFILQLLNLLFLNSRYVLTKVVYYPILFLMACGFLISATTIKRKRIQMQDFDEFKPEVDFEPEKETEIESLNPIEYESGDVEVYGEQIVASKRGKTYHRQDCDWAKKIKKNSLITFDSEADAKKKGYKKCNACF